MRVLNKPEYVCRPGQVLKRVLFGLKREIYHEVKLPWGPTIRVRRDDVIRRSICTYGIYDLVVTETILRLIEPREVALEVGANMGYMTSVMVKKAGARGRVLRFELSSAVFADLMSNIQRWSQEEGAPIEAYQRAVSSPTGTAQLCLPNGVPRKSWHGQPRAR